MPTLRGGPAAGARNRPPWSEACYQDALALLAIEQGDFDETARWLTSSLDVARAMVMRGARPPHSTKLADFARAQRTIRAPGADTRKACDLKVGATSRGPVCCAN